MSQSNVWIAMALMQAGRLDEAREQFAEARATEPISAYGGLADSYSLLPYAYAGDRDGFLAALDVSAPRLPGGTATTPWGTLTLAWSAVQCAALLELPNVAAVVHDFVVKTTHNTPVGFFDGALSERLCGMSHALVGRWDDAESHFTEARRQAAAWSIELDRPKIDHWHGKMLIDRGRPEDIARGRPMLEAALDAYRSAGMPLLAAMVEKILASTSVT